MYKRQRLRFVPTAGEYGYDALSTAGVGHQKQDYAKFDYSVSDAHSSSAIASMTVDIRSLPVFSSVGTASVQENTSTATVVYDANASLNGGASDVGVTYSLSGTDAMLFNINSATGQVTFKTSSNYEAPTDSGDNNVYDFTVRAASASGTVADLSLIHI